LHGKLVNMAARLMQAAGARARPVLCDEATRAAVALSQPGQA
jgi:hypothetical protein